MPAVKDPARRMAAEADFRVFCETYFSQVFSLPWSPDHVRILAKLQRTIQLSETLALAMPRGSGKTSISQVLVLWAILTGLSQFVYLVAAAKEQAVALLDNLKNQLRSNERLLEDFPEALHPIRKLDGESRRATGQRYYGVATRMEWTIEQLVFPTVPGSRSSGAIIRVSGLTGAIRGALYVKPDGAQVRPSLFICDDPQTDESARSWSQCETRERILCQAIVGLGGPIERVAGVVLCTVIRVGDLADRLLDRNRHPEFRGERTKMVYKFPRAEKLWVRYSRLRAESLRTDGDGREATQFYVKHREQMDAGAEIAWPQRFNADEVSAIQHAMNLKFTDEAAFCAEYQNEPMPETEETAARLSANDIAAKLNNRARGQAPLACEFLTAFVDVGEKLLFWCVCAWEAGMTGYVLDYGSQPEQGRAYFTTYDVQRTLRRAYPGTGVDGAIYAGLNSAVNGIMGKEWKREDGTIMRVARCLIDQGWKADIVHQFCRQSPHAASLMPSRGFGVTASMRPISEYKRGPGERIGHHWWIPSVKGYRILRHVEIDTNYWKSSVYRGFQTAMGDKGCLSLWGDEPARHQLFAEHCVAEHFVVTEGRGRKVEEWKLRAANVDNHWFDGLVGCMVGASMLGVPGATGARAVEPQEKPLKGSEIQRRKRLERESRAQFRPHPAH